MEKYIVKKVRQNEVEDIFKVYNTETHEVTYERFPRTMEMSVVDVVCFLEGE